MATMVLLDENKKPVVPVQLTESESGIVIDSLEKHEWMDLEDFKDIDLTSYMTIMQILHNREGN